MLLTLSQRWTLIRLIISLEFRYSFFYQMDAAVAVSFRRREALQRLPKPSRSMTDSQSKGCLYSWRCFQWLIIPVVNL